VIRAIELQVRLQLKKKSVAIDVATRKHTSGPLDRFVIRANSELQYKLQLRYNDVILLRHKLFLSRLSPRHTHIKNTQVNTRDMVVVNT
jgi:hypothetical protein